MCMLELDIFPGDLIRFPSVALGGTSRHPRFQREWWYSHLIDRA